MNEVKLTKDLTKDWEIIKLGHKAITRFYMYLIANVYCHEKIQSVHVLYLRIVEQLLSG